MIVFHSGIYNSHSLEKIVKQKFYTFLCHLSETLLHDFHRVDNTAFLNPVCTSRPAADFFRFRYEHALTRSPSQILLLQIIPLSSENRGMLTPYHSLFPLTHVKFVQKPHTLYIHFTFSTQNRAISKSFSYKKKQLIYESM